MSRQALLLIISAGICAGSFLICSKNSVHNCKNSSLLTSFSFTEQCAIIEVTDLGSWNDLEKFGLHWDIIEIGTSDKTVVVRTEAFVMIHSSTFVSRFLLFSISTPISFLDALTGLFFSFICFSPILLHFPPVLLFVFSDLIF